MASQFDTIFPQEVLDVLEDQGMFQEDLLLWQRRIVFANVPADTIKAMLVGEETDDTKKLLSLLGCIQSPGDKARPLLKAGYMLSKSSPQKSNGQTFWKIQKIQNDNLADPSIPKAAREFYKSEKECFLTFDKIDERTMQIDHRNNVKMTGGYEHGKDPSPEVIRECYMPVSASGNTWKREACRKCQQTGTRPGGEKSQIPFWFKGTEKFDEANKCNGCFFQNPEQWRTEHRILILNR